MRIIVAALGAFMLCLPACRDQRQAVPQPSLPSSAALAVTTGGAPTADTAAYRRGRQQELALVRAALKRIALRSRLDVAMAESP